MKFYSSDNIKIETPKNVEEIDDIIKYMDKLSGKEYNYILRNSDDINFIVENIKKYVVDEDISIFNVFLAIEWIYKDWNIYSKLCFIHILLLKPMWSSKKPMRYMNILELLFSNWSIDELIVYIPVIHEYNNWCDEHLKFFLFHISKSWDFYWSFYLINYVFLNRYSCSIQLLREILLYKNT